MIWNIWHVSIISRQDCRVEMDVTESISCLKIIVLQEGYNPFVITPVMIRQVWPKLVEFLGKGVRF